MIHLCVLYLYHTIKEKEMRTHYNIGGFKIEVANTEPCFRLYQYGKGLPITCKCSVCAAKNQTPEQAKVAMDAKYAKYKQAD